MLPGRFEERGGSEQTSATVNRFLKIHNPR
jgi:hypothetical protein